jgi:hypothetical protein
MGLEKIVKDFDLFGIETHPIPPNPHGLGAKRTSPEGDSIPSKSKSPLICINPLQSIWIENNRTKPTWAYGMMFTSLKGYIPPEMKMSLLT